MPDLTIKPTLKFVKIGAVCAAAAFLGLEILYVAKLQDELPVWVAAVPALILLWPLARWAGRSFSKTVISGDRLRSESGILARSTRNIQLSKIQDVRVDQGVTQRMFNVGNLSIETAGESSRLVVLNVDSPQALADEIMNRSQAPRA